MMSRAPHLSRRIASAALLAVLGAAVGLGLAGCFDAPKLEERWSRIDIVHSNRTPFETVTLGAQESVDVQTTVTYRRILTGYAVAELRASATIDPATVSVAPNADRMRMASDIDSLLAHSVTLGRAIIPVTGWDHLIQPLDFRFSGQVPMVLDSTGAGHGGVFLLCYMGSGQKVERIQGDTIIVTPFLSTEMQILPVGMEFRNPAPAPLASAGR